MKKVGLEQALRNALDDKRKCAEIQKLTGWESSDISRIKSGQQGIKLELLDAVIGALGYVPVEPRYLDYLAIGNEIGSNCQCARAGYGTCGMH